MLTLTEQVRAMSVVPSLAPQLHETLADPGAAWYAALSYSALHSRPVVVQMLREWLPVRLNGARDCADR
ncbi:hypothetical protein Dvina_36145 [Dactylosporangium vinaceum]|uniref:Transcriptional regulator n=1 Tax=Dactylosporangium vinaceum TaxID=53362 RepID=A0ABV5MJB4_9ACTN|nr:hypothetical protein [Dactylosporangium vinaceum]UAB93634.1 hypothetical protein Dvina_36145 [Dactylosporangium vinaceum]